MFPVLPVKCLDLYLLGPKDSERGWGGLSIKCPAIIIANVSLSLQTQLSKVWEFLKQRCYQMHTLQSWDVTLPRQHSCYAWASQKKQPQALRPQTDETAAWESLQSVLSYCWQLSVPWSSYCICLFCASDKNSRDIDPGLWVCHQMSTDQVQKTLEGESRWKFFLFVNLVWTCRSDGVIFFWSNVIHWVSSVASTSDAALHNIFLILLTWCCARVHHNFTITQDPSFQASFHHLPNKNLLLLNVYRCCTTITALFFVCKAKRTKPTCSCELKQGNHIYNHLYFNA